MRRKTMSSDYTRAKSRIAELEARNAVSARQYETALNRIAELEAAWANYCAKGPWITALWTYQEEKAFDELFAAFDRAKEKT
jgi:hypothetical protein